MRINIERINDDKKRIKNEWRNNKWDRECDRESIGKCIWKSE